MSHYRSNLRDIEFNLFEVLDTQHLGTGPFAGFDADAARDVLRELERLCREDVAASFADADRNPPVYDPTTFSVTMPTSFADSYRTVLDGDWDKLFTSPHLGGMSAPPSVQWAAAELLLGANPAIFLYLLGPVLSKVVERLGNAEQKVLAQTWVDRQWGATMVLTEPDAGSDVGAGRTTARQQPDGTWHVEGVKRFITSAEHDMSENIMHVLLARPVGTPGAGGPGTKGLSLFLVPKFLVEDWATGKLGERNGAFVTHLEDKMGLKASTTCELTLGQHGTPAVGYLVGDVHDGIAQMFQVIENARMMVGTKAMATLSTGYLNALEFARTRVQGADLLQMTDKSAPRVEIISHPDVRRSLLLQKAYAEGLRALVLFTASVQDRIAVAAAAGHSGSADHRLDVSLNDLLLPLVKGHGSERAYEQLAHALQTFGGSGYLRDYPVEQYVRDAKIDTLYEGTTAIQGLDLFFRKIVRDNGQALATLVAAVQDTADGGADDGLDRERRLLARALEDTQAIVALMVDDLVASAEDRPRLYRVGLNSTRLLHVLGDLVVGWLLVRQAEIAAAALERGAAGRDRAFYAGKVAAARFFAGTVLPELTSRRAVAECVDLDSMQLDADTF